MRLDALAEPVTHIVNGQNAVLAHGRAQRVGSARHGPRDLLDHGLQQVRVVQRERPHHVQRIKLLAPVRGAQPQKQPNQVALRVV
jgi:hypothetical protein